MAIIALSPSALAQDATELAKSLVEGVRCQEDRAIADLSFNLAGVGEEDGIVVVDALVLIGADETACRPLRLAATALAQDRLVTSETTDVNVFDAARAVVDATLAEAERRAASLKFEVGPPPLNLTRERTGGS